MNYWTNPINWRRWWRPPVFDWWITPSGGSSRTYWGNGALDILLESPLGAHLLGALLSFGLGFLTTGAKWEAYVFAVMYAVACQLAKADALLPLMRYSMREVIWRILIGTVPLGILLLLL
jgi:hypothetical protein